MPSRPDPVLDERFEEIVAQLRAARPSASPELRERVRGLPRVAPAPRRTLFRSRLMPVLAAALLVGAAIAGVVGLRSIEGESAGDESAGVALERAQPEAAESDAAAPPADPGRLQDYRAELTVRVDDLSGATAQAMRIAQSLGGYVVSAQFDGPAGDSAIVVRVPVGRVQDAIARYAGLGTIVAQRFSLQDLQAGVDQLDARIEELQGRIAELEAELRRPNLSDRERAILRSQLEQARQELSALQEQRSSTVTQARTAEISLRLTSEAPAVSSPGVVRDAIDALGRIWAWVLAGLIVAAPFLALAVVGVLVARRLRRRANERLLERS
jgi:hypothetical protein